MIDGLLRNCVIYESVLSYLKGIPSRHLISILARIARRTLRWWSSFLTNYNTYLTDG